MEVTVYIYHINQLPQNPTNEPYAFGEKLASSMMKLAFQGVDKDRQFGYASCSHTEGFIYGLFIQKHPAKLVDYDSSTKEQKFSHSIDSGEYLFVIDLKESLLYFQAKRESGLPKKEEMLKRFSAMLNLAVRNADGPYITLRKIKEQVNRKRIVTIFYDIADSVEEIELTDFDLNLIEEQKRNRAGKRQTYFNPIEEYQEALEESAFRFAKTAQNAKIKAKKGESLKKDPITRGMLEGARKPLKITYTKDNETITELGVIKNKETLHIEGDEFNLDSQIQSILRQMGVKSNQILDVSQNIETENKEPGLFGEIDE